jgi:hypothetical protein
MHTGMVALLYGFVCDALGLMAFGNSSDSICIGLDALAPYCTVVQGPKDKYKLFYAIQFMVQLCFDLCTGYTVLNHMIVNVALSRP